MNNILYVDDEPDLLEIGKLFLEESGDFSVTTIDSAPVALDLLQQEPFDAIVSDFHMPGMDGITFLKTFRATGNETPFIIFTGRGREEVVIEALNSGADFYIQKGGEPESQFVELTHKISHAISRRQADLAVKKSEQDYRHLFDNANEAIFIIQEGHIRTANLRSLEMSGYPEQEILNQPFTLFVHPDDRKMLLDQYGKRIDGEEVPSHYLFRLARKDGTIRWVELNIAPITWDGRPATLNFLTDITQRKLTEDELRESEERYRHVFRTTPDGIFITTPKGGWIDFNEGLVELFGCASREEVFGIPVPSLYAHPEERTEFLNLVERYGYVKEHPVQLRKQDGKTFDALITASVTNSDDSVRRFIGTVRDLANIRASKTSE